MRYWNGSEWTAHRQPMPVSQAVVPRPTASQAVVSQAVVSQSPVSSPASTQPSMAEVLAALGPVLEPPRFDPTPALPQGASPMLALSPSASVQVLAPPPADAPAAVDASPIDDSDPMAEYERQFASHHSDTEPAWPQLPPVQSPPVAQSPIAESPDHTPLIQAPAAPETMLEHILSEVRDAAESPHATGIAEELGGAALAADGVVGFGRGRKGILGALKGMGTGIVVVVLGLGIMGFLGANNTVSAGQTKGTGIVTSLGSTSGNSCTPVARFAVAGTSYSASSSIGISPCPVGLGQTVDVIYSTSDPASNARVEMGSSVTQFLWLIPVLGGLFFLGSLFTFIVRAGSIAGGIALLRDGRRRGAESVEPEPSDLHTGA